MPGAVVSPIRIEKKEESAPIGIRLPVSLLERLDRIVKAEDSTRNTVVVHLLRFAVEEYEAEHTLGSGARKK